MKHYHIKQDENNFYKISERHYFPTVQELVQYHQHNSGGKLSAFPFFKFNFLRGLGCHSLLPYI